jgi:protein-disulfide isomerase
MSRLLIDRRTLMASAIAAGAAFAGPAAALTPVGPDDMVQGDPSAPVTVIEYASASCPHCARWSMEVYPAFYRRFVATGRARYVVREILTDPAALAAAGFLVARCAGRRRYFDVLAAIFEAQTSLYRSSNLRGDFARIAARFGVASEQTDACLRDEAAFDALQARVARWSSVDRVTSTPTFFVNGRRMVGEQSLEDLAEAIAAASGDD